MKLTFGLFVSILFFVRLSAVELTLNQAIEISLKNNQEQKITQLALEIADAQYLQAKSALYLSVDTQIIGSRKDEDIDFELNGNIELPPAVHGLLGTSLPMNVNTVVLGRDTVLSSLNLNYPIYTGGKISSMINQAKLNKKIKQKNIVRKKQDVIFNVKHYFYSYVLANELYENASNTFEKMKFVEELTSNLLNSESLKVKKTDYLRVKLVTSLIESAMHKFFISKELSKSAIANSIGLSWDEEVIIKYDNDINFDILNPLKDLVNNAYAFNVDIQKMKLAIDINDEQIKEARSAFYPQVGFNATAQNLYNSYEYGLGTEQNKNSWTISVGIKIPLFDGMKDTNRILEKKLEKKKNRHTEILLKDAIAMQIKHAFIQYQNGYKQIEILEKTKKIAEENTQLNIKGYQIDLIPTSDVIQAQLTQSYTNVDYFKSVYDYKMAMAKLDQLVGMEVEKIIDVHNK